MDISASSNSSFTRSVTPSKNSDNRQSPHENQVASFEAKSKERALEQRAVQEKLNQSKQENQRRLDGRLITFGHEQGNEASQVKHTSFNRSRVNEAYSPPKNEVSHNQNNQQMQDSSSDAIDIVV